MTGVAICDMLGVAPYSARCADRACRPSFSLRITNPIESTFATARHRTNVIKGPGSRVAGLEMAFKLIESAQARWRSVNVPHLVVLVRAGAIFINGELVERFEDHPASIAACSSGATPSRKAG